MVKPYVDIFRKNALCVINRKTKRINVQLLSDVVMRAISKIGKKPLVFRAAETFRYTQYNLHF